jgi:hypothetical protein
MKHCKVTLWRSLACTELNVRQRIVEERKAVCLLSMMGGEIVIVHLGNINHCHVISWYSITLHFRRCAVRLMTGQHPSR